MKWPWVPRWCYEEAQARARIAEDRLYAAHRDGAIIPPRAAVTPQEPVVLEVLPEKLHAFVQNWESPETRADLEREARHLHFELGMSEERVLALWAARQGEGARP